MRIKIKLDNVSLAINFDITLYSIFVKDSKLYFIKDGEKGSTVTFPSPEEALAAEKKIEDAMCAGKKLLIL